MTNKYLEKIAEKKKEDEKGAMHYTGKGAGYGALAGAATGAGAGVLGSRHLQKALASDKYGRAEYRNLLRQTGLSTRQLRGKVRPRNKITAAVAAGLGIAGALSGAASGALGGAAVDTGRAVHRAVKK